MKIVACSGHKARASDVKTCFFQPHGTKTFSDTGYTVYENGVSYGGKYYTSGEVFLECGYDAQAGHHLVLDVLMAVQHIVECTGREASQPLHLQILTERQAGDIEGLLLLLLMSKAHTSI